MSLLKQRTAMQAPPEDPDTNTVSAADPVKAADAAESISGIELDIQALENARQVLKRSLTASAEAAAQAAQKKASPAPLTNLTQPEDSVSEERGPLSEMDALDSLIERESLKQAIEDLSKAEGILSEESADNNGVKSNPSTGASLMGGLASLMTAPSRRLAAFREEAARTACLQAAMSARQYSESLGSLCKDERLAELLRDKATSDDKDHRSKIDAQVQQVMRDDSELGERFDGLYKLSKQYGSDMRTAAMKVEHAGGDMNAFQALGSKTMSERKAQAQELFGENNALAEIWQKVSERLMVSIRSLLAKLVGSPAEEPIADDQYRSPAMGMG